MESYHLFEEQICHMTSIIHLSAWYEMSHLREPINHNKMESLPLLDRGIPKPKLVERSVQRQSRIGKGVYKPCGMTLDFDLLQTRHFSHHLCTSCFMCGQIKMLIQYV